MKKSTPGLKISNTPRRRSTQKTVVCTYAPWPVCLVVVLLLLTEFSPLRALDMHQFQNERLKFNLFYKGINSAASEMWLRANDSTTNIVWTVKSKPFVTLLFKINNRYETILDNKGELLQANKQIEQKNIQQRWTIDYDWSALRARTSENFAWPILSGCQNLLFMLYDLRTQALSTGDTLRYLLDVESQLWRATGAVFSQKDADGNFIYDEIIFRFSPAQPIQHRAWKTDLLTNRIARRRSQLTIHLGPPPQRKPLYIRFGGKGGHVEMKLKQQ